MSEEHDEYPLDEFASFEVKDDKAKGQFVITVKGDVKYRDMIADRIGGLTFTNDDVKQWEAGK